MRRLSPELACPCGAVIRFAGAGLILEAAYRGSYRVNAHGAVERVKDGAGDYHIHTCTRRAT